jgi:lipopolysaccharide export system ATP-binding protein
VSELRAEGLVKRYRQRTVVDGVSLHVAGGEAVGLLGPNGAGKTTTFYMITGLVRADGGTVRIDDRELGQMPMHRRARHGIGYLPQEPSVFRKLSVAGNVQAILETRADLDTAGRAARLDALLDELGIGHLRDNPAMSLSGGERRRLEIARALATEPRFMLLDEPFAGVDPISVIDIQQTRHLPARLHHQRRQGDRRRRARGHPCPRGGAPGLPRPGISAINRYGNNELPLPQAHLPPRFLALQHPGTWDRMHGRLMRSERRRSALST